MTQTGLPFHSDSSLLVVWPVAALIRVVRSGHLALWRGTLHSWWCGPSWSGPHPGAQTSWLAEWGTEGTLVFRVLLHGIGVIMMGRRGIDWGAAMLRWWSRVWMAHIWRHLGHDVPWGWRYGWGSCGHGGRWGLVVHHMWGPRGLARMLHGVTDRWRWWRWGSEVLLRSSHHVVRVGNHRWLARIVWVVVWGLSRAWPARVGVPRRRVILDGHGDEVAVLASCHCGDTESLGSKR